MDRPFHSPLLGAGTSLGQPLGRNPTGICLGCWMPCMALDHVGWESRKVKGSCSGAPHSYVWCEPLGDAAGMAWPPIHDPDPSRRVTQGHAPRSRSTAQTDPALGDDLDSDAVWWRHPWTAHADRRRRVALWWLRWQWTGWPWARGAIRLPYESASLHTSNPARSHPASHWKQPQ